MKLSNVFSDFKKTNTQCELCRTLEFIIGKTTYRVDVLYCYSNPKSPWSAQSYSEKARRVEMRPQLSLGS
jgi:hypothetical protein